MVLASKGVSTYSMVWLFWHKKQIVGLYNVDVDSMLLTVFRIHARLVNLYNASLRGGGGFRNQKWHEYNTENVTSM